MYLDSVKFSATSRHGKSLDHGPVQDPAMQPLDELVRVLEICIATINTHRG
ncbi:hypothetical protein FPSE_04785 [Fusarium pseudograminearum CS3096]|uniref:Uncharacterized protein n=1 Tax=Fusarium pseudograminearum (strain CS3096) TaxID=1028729 RepID=K3VN00_FUSPC|nr:hypothetical protein FPSE_04785 [Fusarium pseudograminearum CS3096]EKJ75073.1 hypothetical protein FPSE_04785 [Fusarium pseudograminearum CS3096]